MEKETKTAHLGGKLLFNGEKFIARVKGVCNEASAPRKSFLVGGKFGFERATRPCSQIHLRLLCNGGLCPGKYLGFPAAIAA